MSQTSRRKVLAGAGAGVAGTAVVGLGGRADAAASSGPSSSTEAVVAWVADPSAGVVHVMSGEDEVVVTDHDLVARILRAAGGK